MRRGIGRTGTRRGRFGASYICSWEGDLGGSGEGIVGTSDRVGVKTAQEGGKDRRGQTTARHGAQNKTIPQSSANDAILVAYLPSGAFGRRSELVLCSQSLFRFPDLGDDGFG